MQFAETEKIMKLILKDIRKMYFSPEFYSGSTINKIRLKKNTCLNVEEIRSHFIPHKYENRLQKQKDSKKSESKKIAI